MQLQYVWDPFVRIFHWSLVAAFSVAFYTHDSEWDRLLHVRAGYVAGGLIAARILWGFVATGYANFHKFPLNPIWATKYMYRLLHGNAKHYIGHNPTGALVIYAMLALGIIAIGSGYIAYNEDWLLVEYSDFFKTIHHFSTWGWLALVCTHVLGVLFESIIHKDNLILAMITGTKRVCKINERYSKK